MDPVSLQPNERTRDLYEQIAAYAKPPLVPLPSLDDTETLEQYGISGGRLARSIVRAAGLVTGFSSFLKRPPEETEQFLRRVNLRGVALFAPVVSASLVLRNDPRDLDPLTRAAMLVRAALDLHDDIRSGRLEPDRHRGQMLEMGQYPNLFGTSLIIESGVPRVFKSARADRIAVVVGSRFYVVALGDSPKTVSVEDIRSTLAELIERVRGDVSDKRAVSPGILTCGSDRTQRVVFSELTTECTNRESLVAMRHTLFALCLDFEDSPTSMAESLRLVHSGNRANRWFHASLQIVVFRNSVAGFICAFSAYLDGNVMIRAGAECQRRAETLPAPIGGLALASRRLPVRELEWSIDEAALRLAEIDIERVQDDQTATFTIGIGRRELGYPDSSPVPAFVVALQLALSRLLPERTSITQFLSMSRYRCMDLVTGEVATSETERFVKYVEEERCGDLEAARRILKAAIESQTVAYRRARRQLPLDEAATLYLATRSKLQRRVILAVSTTTLVTLRRLRLQRRRGRQVILSHPRIEPEVLLLGRPGVRLPYVKHFGLHYQIHEHDIVLTVMPSLSWTVPNRGLIAELKRGLDTVCSVLSGGP